jgi:hypothetical protein
MRTAARDETPVPLFHERARPIDSGHARRAGDDRFLPDVVPNQERPTTSAQVGCQSTPVLPHRHGLGPAVAPAREICPARVVTGPASSHPRIRLGTSERGHTNRRGARDRPPAALHGLPAHAPPVRRDVRARCSCAGSDAGSCAGFVCRPSPGGQIRRTVVEALGRCRRWSTRARRTGSASPPTSWQTGARPIISTECGVINRKRISHRAIPGGRHDGQGRTRTR